MTPVLTVAAFATLVAAAAALGALLLAARKPLPRSWLGWANAVASGLMLGASYILVDQGLDWPALATGLGAVAGIALIVAGHRWLGTAELDRNLTSARHDGYGAKFFLGGVLHGAVEGVALGVALALDMLLGGLMAAALAVHNVAEGATLCAVLRGQGLGLRRAAALSAGVKLPAVIPAVGVFLLVVGWPSVTPWFLGFGIGALIYLVMVDLLPEAYHQAGRISIALLVSVTLGAIVLLEGNLR